MMESSRSIEMTRETMATAFRRSIEQLDSFTKLLTTRCVDTQENNTCEKPAAHTQIVVAVVVTTGLLLFGSALFVLVWLHLRRRQIDKLEDASDPFELAAYGIEQTAAQKQRRRDRLRMIFGRR
ncbi:hypothetical protein TrVGV298_000322 [Trichoderma virens]|nr:hypothetical protein TrVGV298_000322 [Trichoderma virens]